MFKVAATSLKLEIRLHAHRVGTNTHSVTEAILTLAWLAHAFGTTLLCSLHSLVSGLDECAATLMQGSHALTTSEPHIKYSFKHRTDEFLIPKS